MLAATAMRARSDETALTYASVEGLDEAQHRPNPLLHMPRRRTVRGGDALAARKRALETPSKTAPKAQRIPPQSA